MKFMMDEQQTAWRIRILNGPLKGSAYPVRQRVDIGRASSSDIQLVHDGISRQHALIVTDEQGRHVLTDLDSSNGTFVGGERIRRHVLTPNTTFKIMRVKLIYEEVVDELVDDWPDSGVYARQADGATLRGTVDYGSLDLPQPAGYARATDAPVRRSNQRTSSAPAVKARDEERHRVVATREDGSTYEGNLVDDIVAYRELRTRVNRGDQVASGERDRFEQLEQRLRIPATQDRAPARRIFSRFQCNFPARLRFSEGPEIPTAVLDMGVDGAKLRAYDHQIEHDSIVWLAIHLVDRGRAVTVVFTGRVAWTCRDHVGLGFAGTPGWEHRGHRKLDIRTHMDLGDQVRAARRTLGRIKLRSRRTSS